VRVFLDTNVLASGIATRGLCAELLERAMSEHELLICEPVLRELRRVLSGKVHLPEPLTKEFIDLLTTEGQAVSAPEAPAIEFQDASDIPIMACAVAGNANVFITGDKALLELGSIESVPMLSPRQLWERLAGLKEGRTK